MTPTFRLLTRPAADERHAPRRGTGARILVVSPRAHVQVIPDVFTALLEAGTEVIFSGQGATKIQRTVDRFAHPLASAVALPFRRRGPEAESVQLLRALCDLVLFAHPELRVADWARTRAAERLLRAAGWPAGERVAEAIAGFGASEESYVALTSALARAERALPPHEDLLRAVEALGVDGILLVSRCSLGGPEPDVMKCARRLGLPTVMLLFSWDNLSSKAALHEHPDHLLVWNDTLAWEASAFHGFPPDRVRVLGAPNFDRFFAELEASPAPAAATDEPATILYLGSSKASRDEPAIFDRWLRAIRSAADPIVREARVVLRPHPGGADGSWERWQQPADPLLTIELGSKNEPVTLAGSLRRAHVVVALSTSAEIEAAIAGRPVVTFRAGSDAPGQEGLLHFRYLLEERGGHVIDSVDLDEHVENLGRVLRGGHDRDRIGAFVERFVRPQGVTRPVSPIVASAVLDLVAGREPATASAR
jgi:hypothetical protein